jgi:hypothetical protein
MTTTAKDIQICINVHFDAVSLWIGSFGGADSPCDISRGVFAAKRGVPRLLELFRRYGIITTWHITGHSMESFPKASEMIVKDGHEIGIHGYSHENPIAMSRQQETDVLDKAIELSRALTGKSVCNAVGGVQLEHHRAAAVAGLLPRLQHDGRGLPSLLPAHRGQLDQDRLFEEGRGLDETMEGRQGSRPRRDSAELASR